MHTNLRLQSLRILDELIIILDNNTQIAIHRVAIAIKHKDSTLLLFLKDIRNFFVPRSTRGTKSYSKKKIMLKRFYFKANRVTFLLCKEFHRIKFETLLKFKYPKQTYLKILN